jgi:hypothetical protein
VRTVMRPAGERPGSQVTLFLWLVCVLIASSSNAQAADDNPGVTAQLNDAQTIVAKIKTDAAKMQSYARTTGLSCQTHIASLERIKADVNDLQPNMRHAIDRAVASPWQQEAIDRITGLANDLATNMNPTIHRLNKSKFRPSPPPVSDGKFSNRKRSRQRDRRDDQSRAVQGEGGKFRANSWILSQNKPAGNFYERVGIAVDLRRRSPARVVLSDAVSGIWVDRVSGEREVQNGNFDSSELHADRNLQSRVT